MLIEISKVIETEESFEKYLEPKIKNKKTKREYVV